MSQGGRSAGCTRPGCYKRDVRFRRGKRDAGETAAESAGQITATIEMPQLASDDPKPAAASVAAAPEPKSGRLRGRLTRAKVSDPAAADPGPAAPVPSPEPASEQPSQSADPGGGNDADSIRDGGIVLLDALSEHVPGAREHAEATATYAFATSVELGGSREYCEMVREVARLHEVGKIYLSQDIANVPPDQLLPTERRAIESHPLQGQALLIGAGLHEEVGQLLAATAERFDGRGPNGLNGRAIPLAARVIRAACVYHQGTQRRRGARWRGEPRELGLNAIRRQSGRELDPEVIAALTRAVSRAAAASRE